MIYSYDMEWGHETNWKSLEDVLSFCEEQGCEILKTTPTCVVAWNEEFQEVTIWATEDHLTNVDDDDDEDFDPDDDDFDEDDDDDDDDLGFTFNGDDDLLDDEDE